MNKYEHFHCVYALKNILDISRGRMFKSSACMLGCSKKCKSVKIDRRSWQMLWDDVLRTLNEKLLYLDGNSVTAVIYNIIKEFQKLYKGNFLKILFLL